MGIAESLKQFYDGIEESYYNFCDYLQQNIHFPVYDWFVTPIETRGIPSFPFFIALVLLIIGGGVFAYLTLTAGTTSIKVSVEVAGTPAPNIPVSLYVDGKLLKTVNSGKDGIASFDKVPLNKQGKIRIDEEGFELFEQTFKIGRDTPKIIASLQSSGDGGGDKVKVRVTLKVTDTNDIPLSGASVSYYDSESGNYDTAATDASGTSTLIAANQNSELSIDVSKTGYQKATDTIFVSAGKSKTVRLKKLVDTDDGDIDPKIEKGEVLVAVADEEGNPLDAQVSIFIASTDAEIDIQRTYESGKAHFTDVDAVGARIYISVYPRDEGYLPYDGSGDAQVLTSKDPLEFSVQLARKEIGVDYNYTLIVREIDEGPPIESAAVKWYNQETNARLSTGYTDADGMATFSSDKAVYATIYLEGYLPSMQLDMTAGEPRIIELIKVGTDNSGKVKAIILDSDGNLVPGAKVNIHTADGFFVGLPELSSLEDGTATFEGVPIELADSEAQYVLKASAHGVGGISSAFPLQPEEEKEVVVKLDQPKGTAIIKLKDATTQKAVTAGGSAIAYLRADDTEVPDGRCEILNGTCEVKIPSDKAVYFKINAAGFLPLETEDFSVQFEEVKLLEASVIPAALRNELFVSFDGIADPAGDDTAFLTATPSLTRGAFYLAKFTLNIPQSSEKGGMFVKISGREGSSASEDFVSISDYDMPENSLITKGQTYKPSSDCESDVSSESESGSEDIKWLNFEFPKQQGTKSFRVLLFVKPTAKAGDLVGIDFRGYAAAGKIFSRVPEDAEFGAEEKTADKDSCYAATNRTSFKVTEDRFSCKNGICLSMLFQGSKGKVSKGFSSPTGVPFKVIIAGRALRDFGSPYFKVSDDSEIKFGQYSFTVTDGDGGDGDYVQVQLEELGKGSTASGDVNGRGVLPSAYSKLSLEFGDEGGVIHSLKTTVQITGTNAFDISVTPTELQANEDGRVTVVLKNSDDGEPVTDAEVSIEEEENAIFEGNTPESILGSNADGRGRDGKYVFKKVHPLSEGTFKIVAKREGYENAEAGVVVTLNDFLEASANSLSFTCDGGTIELTNLLSAQIYVLAKSACLEILGDGVTASGSQATFSLKGKGSKELTLNPTKEGTFCDLSFDSEAGGAHANIRIPTRINCNILEKVCLSDAQCPADRPFCDFDAGSICKRRPQASPTPSPTAGPQCTNDNQCATWLECKDGNCVSKGCSRQEDCEDGFTCKAGLCKPSACTVKENCNENFDCINGICTLTSCTYSNQCEEGQQCISGKCATYCTNTNQCTAGYECNPDNGNCDPIECSEDNPCLEGYLCSEETRTCYQPKINLTSICTETWVKETLKCESDAQGTVYRVNPKGIGGATNFYLANGSIITVCVQNPNAWDPRCADLLDLSCPDMICEKEACTVDEDCGNGLFCYGNTCELYPEANKLPRNMEILLDDTLQNSTIYYELRTVAGNFEVTGCDVSSAEANTNLRMDKYVTVDCDTFKKEKLMAVSADYRDHPYYNDPETLANVSFVGGENLVELNKGKITIEFPGKDAYSLPTKVIGPTSNLKTKNGTVLITENGFEPSSIRIETNQSINWINMDDEKHGVSSFASSSDGGFENSNIFPGSTYTHKFTKPGVYNYRDPSRTSVRGVVTVGDPETACRYKNMNYFAQRFIGHLAKSFVSWADPNAGRSAQIAYSSAYKIQVGPSSLRTGSMPGLAPSGVYGANMDPWRTQFDAFDPRNGNYYQQQWNNFGQDSTLSGASDPGICRPNGNGFDCNIVLTPFLPVNGMAFTIVNDYALYSSSPSQLLVDPASQDGFLAGMYVDRAGPEGLITGGLQFFNSVFLTAPRFSTFVITNDPEKMVYEMDGDKLSVRFDDGAKDKFQNLIVQFPNFQQAFTINLNFVIDDKWNKYALQQVTAGQVTSRLTTKVGEQQTSLEPYYFVDNIPNSELTSKDLSLKRGKAQLDDLYYSEVKVSGDEETKKADLETSKNNLLELKFQGNMIETGATLDVIGNLLKNAENGDEDIGANICQGRDYCAYDIYSDAHKKVRSDMTALAKSIKIQKLDYATFGDYAWKRLVDAAVLTLSDYAADKAQYKICGGAKGWLDVCSGKSTGSSNYDCYDNDAHCDNSVSGGEWGALIQEQFAAAACDAEVVANLEAIFNTGRWDELRALMMRVLARKGGVPRLGHTKPIVDLSDLEVNVLYKVAADGKEGGYILENYKIGNEASKGGSGGLIKLTQWAKGKRASDVETELEKNLESTKGAGIAAGGKFEPIRMNTEKKPQYFYLTRKDGKIEVKLDDEGKPNLFTMNKYPFDLTKDDLKIFSDESSGDEIKLEDKYISAPGDKNAIKVYSCNVAFKTDGDKIYIRTDGVVNSCEKYKKQIDLGKLQKDINNAKSTSASNAIRINPGKKELYIISATNVNKCDPQCTETKCSSTFSPASYISFADPASANPEEGSGTDAPLDGEKCTITNPVADEYSAISRKILRAKIDYFLDESAVFDIKVPKSETGAETSTTTVTTTTEKVIITSEEELTISISQQAADVKAPGTENKATTTNEVPGAGPLNDQPPTPEVTTPGSVTAKMLIYDIFVNDLVISKGKDGFDKVSCPENDPSKDLIKTVGTDRYFYPTGDQVCVKVRIPENVLNAWAADLAAGAKVTVFAKSKSGTDKSLTGGERVIKAKAASQGYFREEFRFSAKELVDYKVYVKVSVDGKEALSRPWMPPNSIYIGKSQPVQSLEGAQLWFDTVEFHIKTTNPLESDQNTKSKPFTLDTRTSYAWEFTKDQFVIPGTRNWRDVDEIEDVYLKIGDTTLSNSDTAVFQQPASGLAGTINKQVVRDWLGSKNDRRRLSNSKYCWDMIFDEVEVTWTSDSENNNLLLKFHFEQCTPGTSSASTPTSTARPTPYE